MIRIKRAPSLQARTFHKHSLPLSSTFIGNFFVFSLTCITHITLKSFTFVRSHILTPSLPISLLLAGNMNSWR